MDVLTAESLEVDCLPQPTVQTLQTLIELMPAAIAVLNPAMQCLMVNEQWHRHYGPASTISATAHHILFPATAPQWQQIQQQCLAQATVTGIDIAFTQADGPTQWVQWEARPWLNEHGHVQAILLWTQFITAHQHLEVALTEATTTIERLSQQSATATALENQYKSLTQAVPVGIFRTDAEGQCVYVNQRWCEIAGISTEAALGQGWINAVHPDDREGVITAWQQSLASHTIFQLEGRFQRPDGLISWVYTQAVAERNGQGEITGYVGSITDISDRQAMANLLQASEAKFRQLVENAHDLIWSCTLEGVLTYLSPNARNWLGYEIDELLGTSIAPLIHPEEVEAALAFLDKIATTGADHSSFEFRHRRKDGSYFWVASKVAATTNTSGQIIGFQGILRDISERKAIEEELQQNKQLLELVMDALPQNTFWKNRKSVYLGCNKRYAQLCGLSHPDQIIGKTDYDLPYPLDEANWYRELDRRVMDNDTPIFGVIEPQQYHEDGRRRWSETNKIPLHNDDGEVIGVLGTFQDVTARVEAQVALEASEADLRQQAQALEQTLAELRRTQTQMIQAEKMSSLGQLVAGVAHEINNPVNFIYGNLTHAQEYTKDLIGLIQLYQAQFPDPGAAITEELEAIDFEFLLEDLPKLLNSMKVGADRIQAIVASLRTFSRMDEADMKAVDIHTGIDSTLVILHNRIKAKSDRGEIAIAKHYGDLPLVECYAGQLNQVFMNLLSNAIDALEEALLQGHANTDPPTITITTQITAAAQVEIRIADNGTGMPTSVRNRIFDPFFTTKPVGSGTGMGLSISYQIIVEKHGGTIKCRSQHGRGTEFVITIPLTQSD